ncbi:MAG: 50S ribosomal protein L11 [Thermoplasmata archaeon]|nr:MAG: 50S ribosomal protein L11 [Thermoplasmata archaeon]
MRQEVEVLIEGGKATPGPPVGPALGPLGINVGEVVKKINELTRDFEGMKVPVKIKVDPNTKEYEIEIGTPPVAALVMKELSVEKASSNARTEKVGDLRFEQVVKIARMKSQSMTGSGLKSNVKTVLGTCLSMGVTVDGKDPRDVQRLVDKGEYDKYFEK